jgi:hypothetical protein
MGSTREARRAGAQQATGTMSPSKPATAAKVRGSVAATPFLSEAPADSPTFEIGDLNLGHCLKCGYPQMTSAILARKHAPDTTRDGNHRAGRRLLRVLHRGLDIVSRLHSERSIARIAFYQ